MAFNMYVPLRAALQRAASSVKPLMLAYEQPRNGMQKKAGHWNGLRCWAAMRVARMVGGTEDSEHGVSL
jgi:hypothetical protein